MEALDLVDQLAEQLHLDMDFRPGDMQFVNNYHVFHSRTKYEDHEEPGKRRHLMRLWLSSEKIPERPAAFSDRSASFEVWRKTVVAT